MVIVHSETAGFSSGAELGGSGPPRAAAAVLQFPNKNAAPNAHPRRIAEQDQFTADLADRSFESLCSMRDFRPSDAPSLDSASTFE